jgi:hypothetical protein
LIDLNTSFTTINVKTSTIEKAKLSAVIRLSLPEIVLALSARKGMFSLL